MKLLFTTLLFFFAIANPRGRGQDFPKGVLGDTPDSDQFKARWYSNDLHALQEPSLLTLAKHPSAEAYRFLWLRTFHHPVAIRIDIRSDGTAVLIQKTASGASGFNAGALFESSARLLSREQTQALLARLNNAGFWDLPSQVHDQTGTDGSQWVIEGVKEGKYHLVDRWSPHIGPVYGLGIYFLTDLAKMDIPKQEMY